MPDFFRGTARNLDYKTLRYIGHYEWIESLLEKFTAENSSANSGHMEDLSKKLLDEFLREIPLVEDDFVLAHAAVDGFDANGTRRMLEKAFFVEPVEINDHFLRAIQVTTAAPLCEAAIMLLSDKYKGVILQSQLNPQEFLNGNFVARVYKKD